MRKSATFAALAIMLVGMVGSTEAAFADKDSYVTGGHAWRSDSDKTVAYIADTLANNESVFMQYKVGSSTVYRLNNQAGYGATVSVDRSSTITALQACRDINLLPDECDSWK